MQHIIQARPVVPQVIAERNLADVEREVLLADMVKLAVDRALYDGPETFDGVGVDRPEQIAVISVMVGPPLLLVTHGTLPGRLSDGGPGQMLHDLGQVAGKFRVGGAPGPLDTAKRVGAGVAPVALVDERDGASGAIGLDRLARTVDGDATRLPII